MNPIKFGCKCIVCRVAKRCGLQQQTTETLHLHPHSGPPLRTSGTKLNRQHSNILTANTHCIFYSNRQHSIHSNRQHTWYILTANTVYNSNRPHTYVYSNRQHSIYSNRQHIYMCILTASTNIYSNCQHSIYSNC